MTGAAGALAQPGPGRPGAAVTSGRVAAVACLLSSVAGGAIFRPEHRAAYRRAACTITGGPAPAGLAVWN